MHPNHTPRSHSKQMIWLAYVTISVARLPVSAVSLRMGCKLLSHAAALVYVLNRPCCMQERPQLGGCRAGAACREGSKGHRWGQHPAFSCAFCSATVISCSLDQDKQGT